MNTNKIGDPGNPLYLARTCTFSRRYEFGIEKREIITDRLSANYVVNLFTAGQFNWHKQENPSLPRDLRFHDNERITPGLSFGSGFFNVGNHNIKVALVYKWDKK